ncbi:hypothetical protein [Escherichia coli]|uniref:hypothetical protein n=1 Tax=Escherichia coli TaxID=562 RepID=UPI00388FADE4
MTIQPSLQKRLFKGRLSHSNINFYDKQFHPIDLINTTFEDQADKYIFWRYAADRAKIINAYGFIWISELWLRKASINSNKPIHTMPIIDERLQVIGIDSNNNQKCISWKIVRENKKKKNDFRNINSRLKT